MKVASVVSVSGGKDSTALWLLALERDAPGIVPVFADTGHEHPATLEYVNYLAERLGPVETVRADFSRQIAVRRRNLQDRWSKDGVPQARIDRALELLHPTGVPFLDMCLLHGRFPSTRARFCSTELKHMPIRQFVHEPLLDAGYEVVSWQGIRRDESRARANALPVEIDAAYPILIYRPILDWTADDAFNLHRRHGVEPNPLYKMGCARVGCMPCIHVGKAELRNVAARWPEEIERVAEWERMVADASKRGLATFFASDKTPGAHQGQSTTQPGIHAVVDWSRTTRGGKSYDLLALAEDYTACSSQYGLCE